MTSPAARGSAAARVAAIAVCLGSALAGCVQTGDFGRPRIGLWNDLVLEPTGSIAARVRGESVSSYVFTDDENELRDRAWRFLMPAHERAWFRKILAELVRTRILPASVRVQGHRAYHHALMEDGGPSPVSRYRRLSEDIVADAKLIGPFVGVAGRVLAADDVRLRSLAYVQDLTEGQVRDAAARIAENRCVIAWVRLGVVERIASYRHSIEHLVIEAPQSVGVPTERALLALEAHQAAFDTLPIASWDLATCGIVPTAVASLPAAPPPAAIVVKD